MKEINGLKLTFNILLGTVSPEEAQASMEHIQSMIDDFLQSKNVNCTGGSGEFLFDGDYYLRLGARDEITLEIKK